MNSRFAKWVIAAVLLLSTVLFIQPVDAAAKEMKVHFIDVGQGDSIYIHTAAGENILIDAGNGKGTATINYLKKQKVRTINYLISTHPDADHMGGLNDIVNNFNVKTIYAPKVSHTTQVYKDFLTAVKKKKLTIKTARRGVKIPVKGVTATFLAPVKDYGKTDLNNWSAVLKLTYGKKSFLFTGDAETKSENDMIQSKQNLKADVLKVGHHGAKTSTNNAFLQKVKPSNAIISVGKKNNYGHPTSTVLNNLKSNKVNVYRTDKQGTIIAVTNGSSLKFNVQPSVKAVSATTPTYKLNASLDNAKPKQNGTVKLTVKGLPAGTKYKAVFHYKSKDTKYDGKVGTALPVKIGRAAKGFKVKIDVTSTYKNKTYKASTSFTPK